MLQKTFKKYEPLKYQISKEIKNDKSWFIQHSFNQQIKIIFQSNWGFEITIKDNLQIDRRQKWSKILRWSFFRENHRME